VNENLLLVGNGSSVLKQKNGRLIDNFGTVVRFNSYKTANFEDYVEVVKKRTVSLSKLDFLS